MRSPCAELEVDWPEDTVGIGTTGAGGDEEGGEGLKEAGIAEARAW